MIYAMKIFSWVFHGYSVHGLVSRCQTSFLSAGRYRFQYTESDNALRLKKRSGNARLFMGT